MAPAWLATRADPAEALRGANRSTTDHASLVTENAGHRAGDGLGDAAGGRGFADRSLINLQHQRLRLRVGSSRDPQL